MTDLSGQYLGRYHLLEPLGEGGMAVVYKAYDTRLEREVAIKIIRSGAFPADTLGEALKRFEREAKSLAKLSHPNIVKVHDFGEHEGSPYLVMEYLSGGTLKKFFEKLLPWRDAIRLILPIARGVAYAHQRGILHRDIKPANILITETGEPMLSDFGIAKLFEGEQTTALTGSGMAIGTPEYMAPEQWGGKTSPQSDLYSLGIVMYEMVAGRKPYVADTPAAILIKQATEPLPSPRKFVSDLPEMLEYMLIKALAKESEYRYADVNVFIEALEDLLINTSPSRTSLPPEETLPQPVQSTLTQVTSQDSGSTTMPTESPEIQRVLEAGSAMQPKQAQAPLRFSYKWIAAVFGVIVIVSAVAVWSFYPGLIAAPIATATIAATEVRVAPTSTSIAPRATLLPEVTSTPTPTLNIGSTLIGKDGATLMYVPEGEFTMGSTNGNSDEEPVHTVNLDAFWIDQIEVTNVMYAKCVDAGICKPPSNTIYFCTSCSLASHPFTSVDWNMANTYCSWAGRRLPTEAEWEKAARGTDGRTYPWGNEAPNIGLLNINDGVDYITSGGRYPNGKSIYGVYDMAGNVWEWVSSLYQSYPFDVNDGRENMSSAGDRVRRGGSWLFNISDVRSALRGRSNPSEASYDLGFRCAKDAP